MKSSKRLVLGAIALACLGLMSVAHAQKALEGIEKTKLIKIAIPTDFPPYGFVGIDMAPQGLDVEMARLIASKLGVKVELIPVTSANRIPYLQTRRRTSSYRRWARTPSAKR